MGQGCCCCCQITPIVSDSVRPHGRQPTRLPSPGFSRQEHWSGLPFPSPAHESESQSEGAQSCPTLRDPMDCSPPGSSIHGISEARVVERGAIAFSRGRTSRAKNGQGPVFVSIGQRWEAQSLGWKDMNKYLRMLCSSPFWMLSAFWSLWFWLG